MIATTPNLDLRDRRTVARLRRLAQDARWLLGAIGARWNAVVESSQLGPSAERSTARHLGARI